MRMIFLTLWFFSLGFAAVAACSPDAVSIRGNWGKADFKIEIADTDDTRAKGLMFREKMPMFSGMLFVYEGPQNARFWMKNTLLPLDMIFLDQSGMISRIHERAVPQDLTVIDGGTGVLAVLEVNAGLVNLLGITVGNEMQHPAFAANAAWPCE